MTEVFIFDAIRTPRGRGKSSGALHEVKPVKLLSGLMKHMAHKHQLDTALVDDVVIGCVSPVGEQGSVIARTAALSAGWDLKAAGIQVNRFCVSVQLGPELKGCLGRLCKRSGRLVAVCSLA